MRVVENEDGSQSYTTDPDIPTIVFILEADASVKAIYPADEDERRRVMLSLSREWLELFAKALEIDLDELLDDESGDR